MADDDRALGYQLSATLAVDREGRHAGVDLPCRDRLGEEVAARGRPRDAVGPACRNPEVAAVRMGAEQRAKICTGVDVPRPLPQYPEVRETGHHIDQMAGVMGNHWQVRRYGQAGNVPRDFASTDDLSACRLMYVDGTVEHSHRRIEDGTGRL